MSRGLGKVQRHILVTLARAYVHDQALLEIQRERLRRDAGFPGEIDLDSALCKDIESTGPRGQDEWLQILAWRWAEGDQSIDPNYVSSLNSFKRAAERLEAEGLIEVTRWASGWQASITDQGWGTISFGEGDAFVVRPRRRWAQPSSDMSKPFRIELPMHSGTPDMRPSKLSLMFLRRAQPVR